MHEKLVHVTGVGSSEIALIITAAAGVLGATLGAGATGLVSFRLESRRELARARAGARLVRSDFEKAAATIGYAQSLKQWSLYVDLRVEGWEDFRDVIAVRLDPGEWNEVDGAVRMVRGLQESQETTRQQRKHEPDSIPPSRLLDADQLHLMDLRRKQITAGYNVLASLAEGPTAAVDSFGLPPG